MAIAYDEKNKIFYLSTPNTSYIIGIMAYGAPVHIHYGKKISHIKELDSRIFEIEGYSFSPQVDIDTYGKFTLDMIPHEYPSQGDGDYRNPALNILYPDGSAITRLKYLSHKIYNGKPKLNGLPAVYTETDNEAQTLELVLYDDVTNVKVILKYTAFSEIDAITRSAEIINCSEDTITILNAQSTCVDMENDDYEFIHLHGSWARERHIKKIPLNFGNVSIDSKRGVSSHNENPFFALAQKNSTETTGEVYGFNLIYSGNFIAAADMNYRNLVRAYIGINPFNFRYTIESGESFQTPEAVMVYSDKGIGKMSRTFHELYRTRLCRGKYRDVPRPILLNLWEATGVNVNEEIVLKSAEEAKKAGIETVVLDDGWFGKRNNVKSSLGDWYPDKDKFPDGIEGVSKKLTDMGMKFGIWIEPEMISPDSELYRAHPDWCIHTPERYRSRARSQLVLDITRKEIRDHIYETIADILRKSDISYVKWDMNRSLSEVYSAALPPERQGEVSHRYVLALYELMERFTEEFPDILFEGCSAGGARFDGGILYYMPQIWVSDNTDAVERMYIQHGTSIVYPASCMGAHVSVCPNHQVRRITPFGTRTNIAMAGRFGYELDINNLTDEEKAAVMEDIKRYKYIEHTVHHGDMYRLLSPFESDYTAWQFTERDKSRVVVITGNTRAVAQTFSKRVKLIGLEAGAEYKEILSGKTYSADSLMNMGLLIRQDTDFNSDMFIFEIQWSVTK